MASNIEQQKTALERLIAEPKGKTAYTPGQAFLLHVFWECPSLSTAQQLLQSLAKCAAATHRDTPCVPIYFFRISNNNADLCPAAPKTIEEHPTLRTALRKLRVGVPRGAITADLARQGLDTALLDLDPSADLPPELQQSPVAVECTELYLDERAFNEHAGSRDYLDAYAGVMDPALRTRTCTVRMGTPTPFLIERVLEPMLKEKVAPMSDSSVLWRRPSERDVDVFVSLDVRMDGGNAEDLVEKVPHEAEGCFVMKVAFDHPLREGTARFMGVLSKLRPEAFEWLKDFSVERGEVRCDLSFQERVVDTLRDAGLEDVRVNASESVGYSLHARSEELTEVSA
ncbi:hypothetical protein E8E12_002375 [Didymella heteroderae]|uniref:Uncharacterized protein n=1 Tax=Didymella heteroderae TaxID=1769908 RepID=A0A9P4WIL0_9PLEO|nr:hypothetical protein E8E12_002375 [Didymella heteroderae]